MLSQTVVNNKVMAYVHIKFIKGLSTSSKIKIRKWPPRHGDQSHTVSP